MYQDPVAILQDFFSSFKILRDPKNFKRPIKIIEKARSCQIVSDLCQKFTLGRSCIKLFQLIYRLSLSTNRYHFHHVTVIFSIRKQKLRNG